MERKANTTATEPNDSPIQGQPWVVILRPTRGQANFRILRGRKLPSRFIDVAPFEELPPSRFMELRILNRGGHVGFIGRDGHGGLRWAERQVTDWMVK